MHNTTKRTSKDVLFSLVAELALYRMTDGGGHGFSSFSPPEADEEDEEKDERKEYQAVQTAKDDYSRRRAMKNPSPATKKDSNVDTISAMEFCFIFGKRLVFALLPLILAGLRALFALYTINPPSSASTRQKRRILYRSRVQSFRDWFYRQNGFSNIFYRMQFDISSCPDRL